MGRSAFSGWGELPKVPNRRETKGSFNQPLFSTQSIGNKGFKWISHESSQCPIRVWHTRCLSENREANGTARSAGNWTRRLSVKKTQGCSPKGSLGSNVPGPEMGRLCKGWVRVRGGPIPFFLPFRQCRVARKTRLEVPSEPTRTTTCRPQLGQRPSYRSIFGSR